MTKAPDSQNPVGPSKALIRALSALLRPLIRMLIAKGVTLPYFTEVAKAVYVDAAQDFADDPGKPLNQSRVSLITGVHRKDIRRLQEAHDVPSARGRAESMGSRLIGIWVGSAAFIDAAGNPLALPRTASADLPSFETLVRTVSTDVRPRSILDEWLRLGLVEVDQDDLIHLNIRAFVPRDDFDETAYFYGRNLRDHIAAASHNLMGRDDPYLERAVFYDGLSAESIAALEQICRERGEQVLLDVNREALRMADADDARWSASGRMTFGAFFYAEENNGPDSPNSKKGEDDA